MQKDFITMKKAAELLDVHPITINRYCKQKILTYYQVGPRKRFLKEDIDDFIKGAVRHANNSKDPFDTN